MSICLVIYQHQLLSYQYEEYSLLLQVYVLSVIARMQLPRKVTFKLYNQWLRSTILSVVVGHWFTVL